MYKVDAAKPGEERPKADSRYRRPDGSMESTALPTKEALASFLAAVSGKVDLDAPGTTAAKPHVRVLDGETGAISEQSEQFEDDVRSVMAKVAAFLDPNSVGPVGAFEVRHKLFVMRIPTRDEIQPIANEQAVVEFYSR